MLLRKINMHSLKPNKLSLIYRVDQLKVKAGPCCDHMGRGGISDWHAVTMGAHPVFRSKLGECVWKRRPLLLGT